jgi:capreomycidine synthase
MTAPRPADRLARALLEEWMREYYFAVDADIGSSGVEDYSMAELRRLTELGCDELDGLVFHDSETLGGGGLRRALAARFCGGDAARVMVTHGSTEANYLAMHALLGAGDEVVILDPCYQQLYAVAEALGCRLRRWRLSARNGFRPDLERGLAAIRPGTRLVVVNFPHNPTGAVLDEDEQSALLARVAEVGAYLLWDGVFAELVHSGAPLPDPAARYERAVSLGSLSKAYGLPGLRVGWMIAPPEVLARAVHLRDYLTLHLSPLVELVAQRAVEAGDRLVEPRRRQVLANLDTVAAWARERADRVEWIPPAGGACAFPRLRGDLDVDRFCQRLGREQRVLLVPGSCFGRPRHVRLGFGGSPRNLALGLSRLGAALEAVADRAAVFPTSAPPAPFLAGGRT